MYINCLICYQQLAHVGSSDNDNCTTTNQSQNVIQQLFSKYFNFPFDTIFDHFDTSFCPSCSSNVTQIGQNLTQLQELEAEIGRLKGQFESDLISGYNRSSLSQNDDLNPCDPYFNHRSQLVQGLGLLDCKKDVETNERKSGDFSSSSYEFEDQDHQNVTIVTVTDEFPIKIDKNLMVTLKRLDLPPGRTSFKLSELNDHFGIKIKTISSNSTLKSKHHVNRIIRRKRTRVKKVKSDFIDEPNGFLTCSFNPNCSYRTRSKTRLEVHVKRVHLKKFLCDQCDFMAGAKYDLKKHVMRKHTKEKPLVCEVCGYRCLRNGELKIHKTKHDESALIYKCEICFSGHPTMTRLKVHQTIHKDTLQSCHICGKLLRSNSLQAHIKSHEEDRAKFPCSLCGKSYKAKANLKFHKLSCENKFDFPCTKCPKKFVNDYKLKNHMRFTHEGFRRPSVNCPICQKLITRKCSLPSHMRHMHTGEKPFKCSSCEKSFASRKTMKVHEFVHKKSEENYKFECTFCGKKFLQNGHLYQHLRKGNAKCVAQEKERKKLLLADNKTI